MMKRDMDLVRLILLKVEKEHSSGPLYNLKIDGYSNEQVPYHCKILFEAGLLSDYISNNAGNKLYIFSVCGLTWDGYDFLEKIRDDSTWKKVKEIAKEHGLPLLIDTIKQISSNIISSMTEGAIKAILK